MRSRDELIAAIDQGKEFTYLPFYGHAVPPDGTVGSTCLSQWYPAPFTAAGHTFATAEHYMMWRKATLFGDPETGAKIIEAATPREAKALGRQVRGFDQATWEATRFELVVEGNTLKFGQDQALERYLRGTGAHVLVEASPRDRVWGIGLGRNNPDVSEPRRWRGLNLLGFALGDVRTVLTESRS